MPKEEKKKLTRAELSAIRSKAGKAGAKKRHENAKGRFPTHTTTIRKPDFDVLGALGDMRGYSRAEAIHQLCIGWIKNHPDKKPDGWDEYVAEYPALATPKAAR